MDKKNLNNSKSFENYVNLLKKERLNPTYIEKNFSLREVIYSATAINNKIANIPDIFQLRNACLVAKHLLQPIRNNFGAVEIIPHYSWFRNNELNELAGGVDNSQHKEGKAVDFDVKGYYNKESRKTIVDWCVNNLEFDQLIIEPDWIHGSYSEDGNRFEVIEI